MQFLKSFLSLSFLIFVSAHANAQELRYSGVLSLRSMDVQTDVDFARTENRTGISFGSFFELNSKSKFIVRSGVLYSQRYSRIENTNQGDVDVNYSYFDFPLHILLKVNPQIYFWGGTSVSFNFSKEIECSREVRCEASSVKSVVFPFVGGGGFWYLPELGAEIFYEYIPGELSANVMNMSTLGLNLTYLFN